MVYKKIKIIRKSALADMLGVSRTTLWRMEKSGQLPAAVKISETVSGWLESDIKEWLEERKEVQYVK